jgi:hypothetical protein
MKKNTFKKASLKVGAGLKATFTNPETLFWGAVSGGIGYLHGKSQGATNEEAAKEAALTSGAYFGVIAGLNIINTQVIEGPLMNYDPAQELYEKNFK